MSVQCTYVPRFLLRFFLLIIQVFNKPHRTIPVFIIVNSQNSNHIDRVFWDQVPYILKYSKYFLFKYHQNDENSKYKKKLAITELFERVFSVFMFPVMCYDSISFLFKCSVNITEQFQCLLLWILRTVTTCTECSELF